VCCIQKYLAKKFPEYYPFDKDMLRDKEAYINLKYAIKERSYADAMKYKLEISTEEYKNKVLYKYLHGRLTFYILFIFYRHR